MTERIPALLGVSLVIHLNVNASLTLLDKSFEPILFSFGGSIVEKLNLSLVALSKRILVESFYYSNYLH